MTKKSGSLTKKNGSAADPGAPKPRVYWAVLHAQNTHWRALRSLLRVAMVCGVNGYVNLSVDHKRTDLTRDELIANFRRMSESPDDVLVMLDNDHEFDPHIVGWLAQSQMDITGALAFRRGSPFDPIMFVRCGDGKLHPIAQWDKDHIVQCDMVGHGAISIKRRVFDQLEAAGFKAPFYRYTYPETESRPSEDMYFGECCEKAGISMWCDTRFVIPHLTDDSIDETRWQKWLVDNPENIAEANSYNVDPPQMRVSIVIPTHGRQEQMRRCLDQLFATIQDRDVEVIVCSDDTWIDDPRVKMKMTGGGSIEGWNIGLAESTGQAVVLGADDLWFMDGWLDAALRGLLQIPEKCGMVGFNDMHSDGHRFATHYLMTRDYIDQYNGGVLAIPAYQHNFIDVEATARAKRAGRYYYARDALVEHRHYIWNAAVKDETYERTAGTFQSDQALFERRCAMGFPNDFEPMIIRVLA